MFEKNKSFEISKKFFQTLENKLNSSLKGYYNVFNNNREQGSRIDII